MFLAGVSAGLMAQEHIDQAAASLSQESQYWRRFDEIRFEVSYPADAPKGSFDGVHTMEGYDDPWRYVVHVPETYDPARKIDLHVYLHGGVQYSTTRLSNVKKRRLKKLRVEGAISVYPTARNSAKWWYESQSKNIPEIIKIIKRRYNVDDNRVFLHGLSDGGGGVYYFASHAPTPFAGFIALIGSPHVLREKHNVFGKTFPGNFVNKPIFAVNAEDDEFFPASTVEGMFEAINAGGGDVTFHAVTGNHFGMPWLVQKKKAYESFVANYTRNPYPDRLYWQIDKHTPFNRIHWLIVKDTNSVDSESAVLVEKTGNTVNLSSKNVSGLTLLISPDHFDLSKHVQVWANEKLVFDQQVVPEVQILDKWFEIDGDRSMLFAHELHLDALGG